MLDAIKGVLARPTEMFRELPERASVRDAAIIVLVVALISSAPMFFLISGVWVQATLAVVKVVFHMATWLAIGAIAGLIAVKVFKAPGTVGDGLLVAGFAAVPLGILVLVGLVMGVMNLAPGMGQLVRMLCLGWAILLLYIGTRETRNLPSLAVALVITPAVLVGFGLATVQNRAENYLVCFAELPAIAAVTWDEVPDDYEQVIRNPQFEEAYGPDDAPGSGSRGIPFAPGWEARRDSPFAFLNRPSRELVDDAGKNGGRAAKLSLEGLPQADMNVAVFQEIIGAAQDDVAFLSVRMRTDDAVIAAARVRFLTDNPQDPIAGSATTTLISGTTDWQEYRAKASVPAGTRRILVDCLLGGFGTLWVDEVRLYLPEEREPEEPEPDDEARPAATLESAPERLVDALRHAAPEGMLGTGRTFFVAPVADFTAERVDTAALRAELESAFAGEVAGEPVSRRAERAAGLNEIGFLSGHFVSRSDARDRVRRANVDLVFFAEITPTESPGRSALSLWMMDANQGDIVAETAVQVEGLR